MKTKKPTEKETIAALEKEVYFWKQCVGELDREVFRLRQPSAFVTALRRFAHGAGRMFGVSGVIVSLAAYFGAIMYAFHTCHWIIGIALLVPLFVALCFVAGDD